MSNYDLALLKKELTIDEGKRLTAYRDSLGFWTIGIGHLLGTKKTMDTITNLQCDSLFNEDLVKAEINLTKCFPEWETLDEVRQRALINMSFNLGGHLKNFKKFLAALRVHDWDTAGIEMVDSLWAGQVGSRAHRLYNMIKTGEV
jgi:GH24 family phage-related lysozyme (muramidase)